MAKIARSWDIKGITRLIVYTTSNIYKKLKNLFCMPFIIRFKEDNFYDGEF
ncbi:hypothetical protein BVAVS116_C0009 (plasmid) [Borreliella valaisiana VS116]|uniref:Uncharacterized protein n=1 Tax=Borreliella valaisiana VS116 TaxID=445987 RepID=C0R8V2_BORVA|nr:hypothetical protein BVAVS116_C0009 [Borreliella valaisiana VS116]